MPLEWSPLTWEAAATFATGIAAVVAAYFIGRKQIGISQRQAEIADRQTSILERQTRLAELTLRHELFERRMRVYDAAASFLSQVFREAKAPDFDRQLQYIRETGIARFLFAPEVEAGLKEIRNKAGELRVLQVEMRNLYETEGHYGTGNPEKEGELLTWLTDRLQTLPDLFGDELRLSDHLQTSVVKR